MASVNKITALFLKNARRHIAISSQNNLYATKCPPAASSWTARCWCSTQSQSSESSRTYEVTKDPNEWKYVQDLLPDTIVPSPPTEALTSFPTPSGWVPPQESKISHLPYHVSRTKNHMMPVYLWQSRGPPAKFTKVKLISGDIWTLEAELKEHIANLHPNKTPILTQVHEPGRFIRIAGVYTDEVAQFLINKGF